MSGAATGTGGSVRRRVALVLALLTAAGLLVVAGPGSARAASCGGHKVRTLSFSTGFTHIYKRRGYVCAMTVPKRPGDRRWMSVSVQAWGNRPVTHQGRFKDRAGPVTVHAGHRCVRVKGEVGRGKGDSKWILC